MAITISISKFPMTLYRIGDNRPVSAPASYDTNGRPASMSRLISAVRDRPGIDYTFIEDLREFICLRLDRLDPCKESKEFRQQREKASLLYEKLKEMLPEEGQALLLGYSEALGAAHYLEVAMLGREGVSGWE